MARPLHREVDLAMRELVEEAYVERILHNRKQDLNRVPHYWKKMTSRRISCHENPRKHGHLRD
jgi:hypothetical protein